MSLARHALKTKWKTVNVKTVALVVRDASDKNFDFVINQNVKVFITRTFTLLPSFDISSLKTQPAKILAAAFRDYGAYAIDDAYANGWAIALSAAPTAASRMKHRASTA